MHRISIAIVIIVSSQGGHETPRKTNSMMYAGYGNHTTPPSLSLWMYQHTKLRSIHELLFYRTDGIVTNTDKACLLRAPCNAKERKCECVEWRFFFWCVKEEVQMINLPPTVEDYP